MPDRPGKEWGTQGTVSAAATHVHVGGRVWAWGRAGAGKRMADEIHQKGKSMVTNALLTGLDDNVGQVGQDLWAWDGVGGAPRWGPRCTCIRILIPKISSGRTYLTKAQPELIMAIVMKRRTPFSLEVGRGCGEMGPTTFWQRRSLTGV